MAKPIHFCSRILLTTAISVFVSAAVYAQTDNAELDNNLDNLMCKDVMIMAGIDRDTTIAFMHGYLTRKRGEILVDVDRIEGSTAIFLEDCIDMPTAKAMEILEKALGN